ncbi:uncharacterized protein FTOL_12518 [Fusarium torulosum]|uniref:G domain-containing protein n=1 Tax=Fusarium torulosum TaxID=33205 RepID=A0AAE8MMH4_9HYPO|nr:uncharacterized protein FTOL_12518 [Fusarium torulosum]
MTQTVKLGKDPTACKCGQEEKIVVLVGRTQHGKSSLIRSILDYSGHEKEADKVKVGGFGNDSTTKDTKQFSVRVQLKKHLLKDQDGKERVVDFDKDDVEDLYDFVPSTQSTTDHVHLRIIDTPGLDDSDNSKEAEKTAIMGGKAQQVRVVDERHKFSILRAMANSGRIHTVCFVLDICSSLGATIQSQFKEYLDIFTMSKLAASFHFAHTKVNIDKRFQCNARRRPAAVSKAFDMAHRSSHHFIDNLPDTGDEISVHFSNWGLSGLLRSISRQRSQAIIHLNSPKSDAQRVMDDILKMTLKTQESEWTSEINALEAQKNLWASTKRDVDSRASGELTSWRKIHSQAAELDKTTFVQVGFQEKYERAHFFNRSRLSFSVYASSPIRHFELEKSTEDGGCHWSSEPSRDDTIGKVSYDANLISWSSGTAIWGKIRLMGWVKEAKADELKVLHEEENEAWKDYTATIDRAQVLQDNIDQANTKIKDLRKRIKTFQAQYECLSLDHIPMETLKKTAQYFASSGIISYAYGLGININLSKRFILNTSPMNGDQRKVFEGKQKADCRRRRTYARAVKSLKGDERIQSKWAAKVADSDASIAAASHVLMILSHESLSVGVHAALRESAQNKRPNQWEDVYQQLKEVYYCDAQRWGEYEAKVFIGPTTSF